MILYKINDLEYQKNYAEEYSLPYTVIESGEPCEHKGCLSHQSHPCEGCGRIGGLGYVFHYNMTIHDKDFQ